MEWVWWPATRWKLSRRCHQAARVFPSREPRRKSRRARKPGKKVAKKVGSWVVQPILVKA
jgi:hypothetical protein